VEQRVLEAGNGIDPGELIGERHAYDALGKLLEIIGSKR
jgi:hypothetical protein